MIEVNQGQTPYTAASQCFYRPGPYPTHTDHEDMGIAHRTGRLRAPKTIQA